MPDKSGLQVPDKSGLQVPNRSGLQVPNRSGWQVPRLSLIDNNGPFPPPVSNLGQILT